MARLSALLLAAALAIVACSLPHAAMAQVGGGLAGHACSDDSDCMSRTCAADGKCTQTICGLPVANGGLGSTNPTINGALLCGPSQFYNPNRACTFGFGKCAKAECCDTLACGAGVDLVAQGSYCPAGRTFTSTRLCPGGVCSAAACCIQTRCDSAGGIAVTLRPTLCASGLMFNNAGICARGEGTCTADECCTPDTRTCQVAFADAAMVTRYGLTPCLAPSVLVPARLFNATNTAKGGCCETRTCGGTIANGAQFCKDTPAKTVFVRTAPCTSNGVCTESDCCAPSKGFCDGSGATASITNPTTGACSCAANSGKSYLIGTGCVCALGTQLLAGASTCTPCPNGFYSGSLTAAQQCAQCPASQPFTEGTGTASANDCKNYCDVALTTNDGASGACTNGGTCSSLAGSSGSFTCACPTAWMGWDWRGAKTASTNCDAPSTLLRLRVLAATGVALPADFKMLVNDTAKVAGDAAWARDGTALGCAVDTRPATPTVPTCTTGGAGALSAALASPTNDPTDTRKFVQAKVRLSTNYGSNAAYVVTWACSDGTSSNAPDLDVVLPGPENTNNAMTLVCTAILSRPDMPNPVLLTRAGVVPVAADASSGPALLTFTQGARPVCTLDVGTAASAAPPQCAVNEQPFQGGQTGTLGVANIDMEKYTVVWSCGGTTLATTMDGTATSGNLANPGETVLTCTATFALKRTQVELKVNSVAPAAIQVTAMQAGMNEACVATIPAGASNDAEVSLSCPVSNLASGVLTTIKTDADLDKYLVTYACTTSAGASVQSTSVQGKGASVAVTSTINSATSPTSCTITVAALPPLLTLSIVNAGSAPAFDAHASQDVVDDNASNTCVVRSDGALVNCALKDGMYWKGDTLLSPRALDANKYSLTWACTGATATQGAPLSNSAMVTLDDNPNAGGATVACVGTVAVRDSLMRVAYVGPTLSPPVELRVRQSHQSSVCTASAPATATTPACTNEGLKTAAGTDTILSTGNLALADYRLVWSCTGAGGAPLPVILVAAGVSKVAMQGLDVTVTCTATVTVKPSPLSLAFATPSGGAQPSAAWSMMARQSNQGRGCTVAVAASAGSLAATAPTCLDTQQLLPARSTVLTVPGLDSSRWAVDWACVNVNVGAANHGQAVTLADTPSASGAVANSKTLTLARDVNAGGWTIACTATVTARTNVLMLAAAGDLPDNTNWKLTAQQPAQSSACTVDGVSGGSSLTAAAPSCNVNTTALAAGTPVVLGTTGLPESSVVTWSCTGPSAASVSVDAPKTGVATLTPPTGTVTTCTATIAGAGSGAFFQIAAAGNGLTFSASQADNNNAAMCTVTSSAAAETAPATCATAAARTRTTLTAVLAAGMSEDTIVRFSCTLGRSGASMPVSKTSALSAVVTTPPSVETMTCKAVIVATPPILTVTSNIPVRLVAQTAAGAAKCSSSAIATRLSCDAGAGLGQLPAGADVNLSLEMLQGDEALPAGYYRWACGSSDASIVRAGEMTNPATASATIKLPAAASGRSLTCWLRYTVDNPIPAQGRRLLSARR